MLHGKRSRPSLWATLSAAAMVFALTRPAAAAVTLCVETHTEAEDQVGFRKLVMSELARHPSHQVVPADCQSRLRVDSFRTSGKRYLTVQLDGEVPVRTSLAENTDVAPILTDSMAQVLRNDPMYLAEDPNRWSAVERASRSVLIRGMNTYRVELFETAARTDRNVAFAPGVALGFTRGADHWQVSARLHLAGDASRLERHDRALRLATGMDLGLTWEASRRAPTSAYVSAGGGLSVLRFAGYLDEQNENSLTDVYRWLPTVHLRGGIRLLRVFDFDADAFLQATLPLLPTSQVDDELWGERGVWTPLFLTGLGVGF
ncbi:MAG TPA: hypothetical protein VFQ61_35665 [Polyangiaceae bacterium]|nr:hypothetical protein [Polyangiaceae bacterium]